MRLRPVVGTGQVLDGGYALWETDEVQTLV